MVQIICDECGKKVDMPTSQFKRSKNHFCSRQCHMKFMNRELNPSRMTPEVREKIHNSMVDTGSNKSYQKHMADILTELLQNKFWVDH